MQFTKMHGLGNDYVYFDGFRQPLDGDFAALARRVSDRHFGVGGDGIVLILPDPEADCRMRMFNADGSEAEMCGNAIRCVGKYVYDRGICVKERLAVRTGAGILDLELEITDGRVARACVDLGRPILNGPDIPVAIDADPVLRTPVTVEGETYTVSCVSMGNPHCVLFVETITDALVHGLGPKLETHPLFPNRINVEFVRVHGPGEATMRVWERGSGETLACGTGACAVAVAGVLNGLLNREVTIHLLGGDLQILWSETNDHVGMTGPATHVFDGELDV